MSTMGPLCPEQLTQEETLEEVCVGPIPDLRRAYSELGISVGDDIGASEAVGQSSIYAVRLADPPVGADRRATAPGRAARTDRKAACDLNERSGARRRRPVVSRPCGGCPGP
jgi:hypothetical protein